MVIEIDRTKWEVPRNGLPPRHHSAEKQTAIHTQVNKLLELGVIEKSQASEWSQAHPVPKGDGQWRLTLDFDQLNATTKGLEGWPIPNILENLTRLGTMKPPCFGLLDLRAKNVAVNPKKTKLGFPETQKETLQFIGLVTASRNILGLY
jgi:hypothetical protein